MSEKSSGRHPGRRRSPHPRPALHRPMPFMRLHGASDSNWTWATLPPAVSSFAAEAELNDDHMSALLVWVGCGAVVSTGTVLVLGGVAGVVIITLVVLVPLVLGWRWSGRRTRRIVAALPDLVDMVGRSLRSGASLTQSLTEAAADSPPALARDFDVVIGAMRRGQPAAHALRSWADRVGRVEVRIVAAALSVASRNEAGTARALAGVSHSLRDRSSLHSEVRAQTAQAGASMQALILLPLIFLAFDAVGSGQTIDFLTTEPLGRGCLALAVLLEVGGAIWTATVVRKRSPS